MNVKLFDLYEQVSWRSVWEALLKEHSDQEKSREGYKIAFGKMLGLCPVESDSRIRITREEEDGERWLHTCYQMNNGENPIVSLMMTRWEEGLGMDVDEDTVTAFLPETIVAMTLFEMTWFGFDKETVHKKVERMDIEEEELGSLVGRSFFSVILSDSGTAGDLRFTDEKWKVVHDLERERDLSIHRPRVLMTVAVPKEEENSFLNFCRDHGWEIDRREGMGFEENVQVFIDHRLRKKNRKKPLFSWTNKTWKKKPGVLDFYEELIKEELVENSDTTSDSSRTEEDGC